MTRSPWLNHGHVRLTGPDEATLRRIWETEETIKGVARQLGVSANVAAVWLADICRQHHVTGRTVAVELRRHGLLEAHKKRHLP